MNPRKTAAKLHKECDRDWQRLLDGLPEPYKSSPFVVGDLFRIWAYEKRHIDHFGQRLPKITNITA